LCGLYNKKVYDGTEGYIGKVEDVLLGKGRIKSIQIKMSKKFKFKQLLIDYYCCIKGVVDIFVLKSADLDKYRKDLNWYF
jgi:sporulation protein YlmC with PRC-barrel domain